MINLRYHIVSLTAVFLAIGIGLTLGSTFLDRATVDNLNGQLESLETRLGDREQRIDELETAVDDSAATRAALDEQGGALLVDRLVDVPVMVVTAEGADAADVAAATGALGNAGADLRGTITITTRFQLDDDSSIADLGGVLGDDSSDPSRLRRVAVGELGGELRSRQLLGFEEAAAAPDPAGETPEEPADPATDPATDPVTDPATDPVTDPATDEQPADTAAPGDDTAVPSPERPGIALVDELIDAGFLTFTPVPGGRETATFPAGVRLVIIGGSSEVPDDLVIEPLFERMSRATTTPIFGVVTSALPGDGEVGDGVAVIRQNEVLRELIPTVDSVEHFEGQAAMVLALADVADGIVGHYGLAEDATQLLPPLRST